VPESKPLRDNEFQRIPVLQSFIRSTARGWYRQLLSGPATHFRLNKRFRTSVPRPWTALPDDALSYNPPMLEGIEGRGTRGG
jgi:hypothetical protein